jgi:hypothetical protein
MIMPLRVTNGLPITPQVPTPVVELIPTAISPAEELLPVDAAPAVSAPALQRFSQERMQWCWAACAQMVAAFYNRNGSQCRLARFLFNQNGCCTSGTNFNSNCDQGCDGEDVARVYDHLGITASRRTFAVDFSDVVFEIERGRPVEAGLKWISDQLRGGHLVIIYGFSPSDDPDDGWIRVNDPWDDFQFETEIRYSFLRVAYGMGIWSDTWINIREKV